MADNTPNPNGNDAAGASNGADANQNKDGNANAGGGTNGQQANGGNAGGQGGGDKPDYEKKFGESTRESQRLLDVLKANGIDPKTGKKVEGAAGGDGHQQRGQDANANAGNDGGKTRGTPTFTEAELAAAIPGYTALTDDEKDVLRNAKKTAQTLAGMQRMVAEIYDERVFNKDLGAALKKPEYKELEANKDAFKEYAYKEENLKVPFDHLVRSFLYGLKAAADKGAGGGEQKREGMEKGSGGQSQLGKQAGDKTEMTADEANQLRKTDHRRYNQLLREKKLVITG